jgi:hypothetical protein
MSFDEFMAKYDAIVNDLQTGITHNKSRILDELVNIWLQVGDEYVGQSESELFQIAELYTE